MSDDVARADEPMEPGEATTDTGSKTVTSQEVEAVITRADGTVIDLGVIDAHYKNRFKQLAWIAVRRPLSRRRIRAANRDAATRAKAA